MRCAYCQFDSTRVVDSRLQEPGDAVRRRRECTACGARFTTFERAEGVALAVRKRDGQVEPYNRQKLLGGLLRAVTKRPVTVAELETAVDSIERQVRSDGGEADSERIGELALRALIGLDRVAAIRFASVYRRFEGLDEFEAELRRLEDQPIAMPDQLLISTDVVGAELPPVPSDPSGIVPSPAKAAVRESAKTDPSSASTNSLRRDHHAE